MSISHAVTNKQEYTCAWELLHYLLTEHAGEKRDHVIRLKRAIRKYQNAPLDETRVIESDFDNTTVLLPLPDWLETKEEADEYFREAEYIELIPCAWDCTGRQFTSWYKVFKRRGRFWAYHHICLDV